MRTGDRAVTAAHAHERGYRDYIDRGLTARNPYDSTYQPFSHKRWAEGFAKARSQYPTTPPAAQSEGGAGHE